MKKILKNIEIINVIDSINELMNEKLPTKASWNISKNLRKLDISFKTYIELENKLVKEYALKDDNGEVLLDEGNQPKFAPNNKEKYLKERQELLNCEDEFDFLTINLSDLNNINIKPSILFNLEFMIIDDTNDK